MDVKWIVDKYIFEDRIPKKVFEDLGIEYHEMEYIPFLEDYDTPYDPEDCVVTYGTINAVRHLKQYYGTFLREENLKYHVYSSKFASTNDYLNSDHFFVTFKFLRENPDEVYSKINGKSIFIRPDSGSKSFTGKVIPKRDFDLEMDCMKQLYNTSDDELILVSTPKQILEESRFIICDNEAISYSRYQIKGEHKVDTNTSKQCIDFVNNILEFQAWTPEEIFTLDVALTPKGPKIIELNSFSCAGWYACDEKTIIDTVSRYIHNLWKEQYTGEENV